MLSRISGVTYDGKNERIGSSNESPPSDIARPTAVEVKLLLTENIVWGRSDAYGFHQPSATIWPLRIRMKLWTPALLCSMASTNAWMEEEAIPWASRVLRGNSLE